MQRRLLAHLLLVFLLVRLPPVQRVRRLLKLHLRLVALQ
jgi:hypothetical protein